MNNLGEFVAITIFTTTTAVIALRLAFAAARRLEGKKQVPIAPEVTARLERIEQAVDSIAIEVERISEGQRFTTRLLSERSLPRPTDAT